MDENGFIYQEWDRDHRVFRVGPDGSFFWLGCAWKIRNTGNGFFFCGMLLVMFFKRWRTVCLEVGFRFIFLVDDVAAEVVKPAKIWDCSGEWWFDLVAYGQGITAPVCVGIDSNLEHEDNQPYSFSMW